MKEKKTIMEIIKEKNCPHVQSLGSYAVMTDAGCPKAHMIRGVLCVSKFKCIECEVKK